jgi:two-component system, NarL family, invasion response regulator UvrY
MNNTAARIALADDHVLLRNGLANLLRDLDYTIIYEASNGNELLEKIQQNESLPDIVLMDIKMPGMDGYETTQWLKDHYPAVKVLALSMYDDENAIIRMLKSGARGYVLKDSDPAELKTAIHSVLTKGFHHSEQVTGKLIHTINNLDKPNHSSLQEVLGLNAREIDFLKLACTEMTYREIADKMCLSPRTIDGYRDNLFEKLSVKTRVGLVLFAIRSGIVSVN